MTRIQIRSVVITQQAGETPPAWCWTYRYYQCVCRAVITLPLWRVEALRRSPRIRQRKVIVGKTHSDTVLGPFGTVEFAGWLVCAMASMLGPAAGPYTSSGPHTRHHHLVSNSALLPCTRCNPGTRHRRRLAFGGGRHRLRRTAGRGGAPAGAAAAAAARRAPARALQPPILLHYLRLVLHLLLLRVLLFILVCGFGRWRSGRDPLPGGRTAVPGGGARAPAPPGYGGRQGAGGGAQPAGCCAGAGGRCVAMQLRGMSSTMQNRC